MKPKPRSLLVIALAATPLLLQVPTVVAGQTPDATSADVIRVAGVEWTAQGEARAGPWGGSDALLIPAGGYARLEDAGFLNGTLSFRLASARSSTCDPTDPEPAVRSRSRRAPTTRPLAPSRAPPSS
jgi:hypothetical protein